MPGPTTEVLNEDIRELKADVREIRGTIDTFKSDVHRIDVNLAELRAEFGLAKWLLGLLLVSTISAVGAGIWWAATLTANFKNLETRTGEQFRQIEASIAKLAESNKTVPKS